MSETLTLTEPAIFFDPFAPEGEQFYDPIAAHALILENYRNNKIEHDSRPDMMLADTKKLLKSAQFLGRMDVFYSIWSATHRCAAEDAALTLGMQNDEFFSHNSSNHDLSGSHDDHDGHNHEKKTTKNSGRRSSRKERATRTTFSLDILLEGINKKEKSSAALLFGSGIITSKVLAKA